MPSSLESSKLTLLSSTSQEPITGGCGSPIRRGYSRSPLGPPHYHYQIRGRPNLGRQLFTPQISHHTWNLKGNINPTKGVENNEEFRAWEEIMMLCKHQSPRNSSPSFQVQDTCRSPFPAQHCCLYLTL